MKTSYDLSGYLNNINNDITENDALDSLIYFINIFKSERVLSASCRNVPLPLSLAVVLREHGVNKAEFLWDWSMLLYVLNRSNLSSKGGSVRRQ